MIPPRPFGALLCSLLLFLPCGAWAGGATGLMGLGYAPEARGRTLDGYAFPNTNLLVIAGYLLPDPAEKRWGVTGSWLFSNVAQKGLDRPVVVSDLQYNYSIFNLGGVFRSERGLLFSLGGGVSWENAERSINAQGDLRYEKYETRDRRTRLNGFAGIGWITADSRCPVGLALQFDSAPQAVNLQLLLGCGFA